jgi:hypothetical protein
MSAFKNQAELDAFIWKLLLLVPVEEHPSTLVLDDQEYRDVGLKEGSCWQAPRQTIRLRQRSEWKAEQLYRDRIAKLEARVKELEARKCTLP